MQQKKKKIAIVNNNMNIGGVQKSLLNFLEEFSGKYDITLYLFNKNGQYIHEIPETVNITEIHGPFHLLGIAQSECKGILEKISRAFFVGITKLFGRSLAIKIMLLFDRKNHGDFDIAISYIHNAAQNSFYGGCNEYTIRRVNARKKIAFIHTDYKQLGIDCKENNKVYFDFDAIAACSEGCKNSFIQAIPELTSRCYVVENCQNYKQIKEKAMCSSIVYDKNFINVVSISRLTKEKGIERAIYAVFEAKKHVENIRYYIIGDGVLKKELQELVMSYGLENTVYFEGEQENPYKYLLNADFLLISSYNEAAPMVINEARCLNVPILSTETSSAVEMILNNESGWVCKNSQEDLVTALTNICMNMDEVVMIREKMKKKPVDNTVARYSFERIVN